MKFILIPIVIVFCDQLSKTLIKNYWLDNNLLYSRIDLFGNYVRLTFIENPGIAFGLDTSRFHVYVTCLTIIAIIFISYHLYILVTHNSYEKLSWSFILGGAIGNCIDRIMVLIPNSNYLGVIDFIDIGTAGFRWYTFNIADSAVTIGIIFYLMHSLFTNKPELLQVND